MATNWPPADGTYPTWPPQEIGAGFFSCDNWETLARELIEKGFTHATPTGAERNLFFRDAFCDDGHGVIGRMLVSPDGLRRYPFCVCNNSGHRELLVLWPPFTCGSLAGPVSF